MSEPVESVPLGATCPPHQAAATFTCTRCGTFGCPECAFSSVANREVCEACAAHGLGAPIPWERRREIGTWRAFWATTKLTMTEPTRFFRTPTTHDNVFAAVAHGVLTVSLGLFLAYAFVGLLTMLAGGGIAMLVPGSEARPIGAILGTYGCVMLGASPFLALLAGPMNALMGQVFAAACAHGTLVLAKKARGSFEDTLRVTSYANAPYILQFVPLLGLATWFWMISIEIIGLREVHKCGTDWAAIAAIGYRLFFAFLIVGAYIAIFVGIYALGVPR